MQGKNKLQTTVGDLIVALTDEAERVARNKEESYRLAAAALTHLLVVRLARVTSKAYAGTLSWLPDTFEFQPGLRER